MDPKDGSGWKQWEEGQPNVDGTELELLDGLGARKESDCCAAAGLAGLSVLKEVDTQWKLSRTRNGTMEDGARLLP